MLMTEDFYKILGVARDATKETIKKAFRKKVKEAHPDRDGGDHCEMVAINQAWDTLGNDEKRKRYDQTGESGPGKPTLDEMAQQALAHAFDELLADEVNWLPHENPLDNLVKGIKAALSQHEFEIKKIDSYLTKLEAKATKVVNLKKDAMDLWASMVAGRRQRYAQRRAQLVESIEVTKRAQEMLKDYQAKTEKAPASPAPQRQQGIYSAYAQQQQDYFDIHWFDK